MLRKVIMIAILAAVTLAWTGSASAKKKLKVQNFKQIGDTYHLEVFVKTRAKVKAKCVAQDRRNDPLAIHKATITPPVDTVFMYVGPSEIHLVDDVKCWEEDE